MGNERGDDRRRGRREGEGERGEGREIDPHPEMLSWLREDEMSVQELLQRVQCVITHVGKPSLLFLILFPLPASLLSAVLKELMIERLPWEKTSINTQGSPLDCDEWEAVLSGCEWDMKVSSHQDHLVGRDAEGCSAPGQRGKCVMVQQGGGEQWLPGHALVLSVQNTDFHNVCC